MPNWFATTSLLLWPLVAICFFARFPLNRAVLWTILGAEMLLPYHTQIKFPMVPQIDKDTIAALSVLVGCLFRARTPIFSSRNFGIVEVLILMYVIGPVLTSQMNNDPIVIGGRVLPGVGIYDGLSAGEQNLITLIPFFVGRRLMRTTDDIAQIFRVLVIAGVIYSVPVLFEVRFSPQLHYWVYGYLPTEFVQAVRGAGFRPMVFMGHGLIVAFFAMLSFVAASVLWRTRSAFYRLSPGLLTIYLGAILFLCKSLGSIVYGAILSPLILWSSSKAQVKIAVAIVVLALAYPALRSFDIFPTDLVVDAANLVSSDRAESIKYRFDNERALVDRALERPIFGWGRYGRNRLYNDEGKDWSVTDGNWIITLGQFGLFGFIAEFGLLAVGVFRAVPALRRCRSENDKVFLSSLSLIVAITVLDQLPNSGLFPWTWLLVGALLGKAEELVSSKKVVNKTALSQKLGSKNSTGATRL
jgi:hypothetical protein